MFSFLRFADKRRFQRHPCGIAAEVQLGRATLHGRVVNVSRGGFLLRPREGGFLQDRSGALVLDGRRHACMLLRKSDLGLHFLFNVNLTQGELESRFIRRPQPRREPPADDPYRILGVSRHAGPEQIKRAWRDRVKEIHPDLLGPDADPRAIALHTARLAKLNAAYRAIGRAQ